MDRFVVHEVQSDKRYMHALVIGVGSYPHLLGGRKSLTDSHDGMRQLTSPPVSARAMADWLSKSFEHKDYPGRTVALLLSEQDQESYRNPATAVEYDVELASFDNISRAVAEWKDRGDRNIDDILMFFFCGHGISEGDSMVLLPSDFGSDRDNAYRHSIDFIRLYDALGQYKARLQCFFIDACRSSSDTLAGNVGGQLLQVRPREADGVRIAPVYYSTLHGDEAHGRPGQCSLYTQALIDSLNSIAADDTEGEDDWRVSNFTLSRALDHLMERRERAGTGIVQVPDSTEIRNEFYICHLGGAPRAYVYVTSEPEEELSNAHLKCLAGSRPVDERPPELGREWAVLAPVGPVNIAASAAGSDEELAQKCVRVHPPYKRVRLDLS